MKKELYYAVNGNGRGCVFAEKPARNDHFKIWTGRIIGGCFQIVMLFESEGFQLPDISWNDEPVQLVLTLTTT